MRFLACILALTIASGSRTRAEQVLFSRDVMAVLSKAGCNAGGCHGNQNGKGSLKLSLWGENPAADLQAILKDPARVNRQHPADSLILQKPTLQKNHEGEKRFDVGSAEYQILFDWISTGAPGIADDAPTVRSIQVSPKTIILDAPEKSVQLKVEATFPMARCATSHAGRSTRPRASAPASRRQAG